MKVLTANRLTDGEAVWFSKDRVWAETIDQARSSPRIRKPRPRSKLAGKAAFAANEVVDVDLIDVELVDGAIRPLRLRERIRAAGPTNRLDLGKQARQAA